MLLYRRHTKEFQELIDKSESFVADTTRRYNRLGDKNAAELYFYSATEAGAEFYRQYDDFGNEIPTDLHVMRLIRSCLTYARLKTESSAHL